MDAIGNRNEAALQNPPINCEMGKIQFKFFVTNVSRVVHNPTSVFIAPAFALATGLYSIQFSIWLLISYVDKEPYAFSREKNVRRDMEKKTERTKDRTVA